MNSLRNRLLLAASLILAVFLAAGGWAVERSYRDGAEQAQRDKLQGLVYGLLGVAEIGIDNQLLIAELDLPDPRLRQTLSGLEAVITDEQGTIIWRSPSHADDLPAPRQMDVGQWQFDAHQIPPRFSAAFGLRWMGLDAEARRYTIQVYEDQQAFLQQVQRFRTTLWLWFGAAAAGMLVSLLMVMSWLTRPLRRMARQLQGIQSGSQAAIEGPYPDELRPLASALNTMIDNERRQLDRYRNALGDLAHSLKTPLAVMRNAVDRDSRDADTDQNLSDQINRVQDIVNHQLQRAAAAGRRALDAGTLAAPIARRIANAVSKVHAERGVSFELNIGEELRLPMEQGDAYELLGNLMDNAARFARDRVSVAVEATSSHLCLRVQDNGPGFPPNPERLLQRGVRADSRNPGQGLGLSAVNEIVQACDGRIVFSDARELGGACVEVQLPLPTRH